LRSATPSFRGSPFLIVATLPLLLSISHAAFAQVVHDYTVTVAPDMRRMSVEARFATRLRRVAARESDADEVLIEAQDCGTGKKLRVRGRHLVAPSAGIRCLRYTVNLARAAENERRNASLSPENFIVSPAIWLWRPELDESTSIRIHFDLPEDTRVSVPWPEESHNTFLLGRSPESANATVVFGRFEYHELHVPQATLRVSLIKSSVAMNSDAILNWLAATATDVTLTYGRFPNPSPQIVVLPAGVRGRRDRSFRTGGASAVRFGRVVRDGGESVELFVNYSAPLEKFLQDSTATHEFSHLMLPYVSRKQKWISEGFAQYYQNILLARSGAYEPVHAWQKLYDGLERGRKSRPELSPNGAAAGDFRGGLMKVYWSGAALALLADMELRERSDGAESLDLALDRLQACCLPAADVWTGPELMARLDSMLSSPVFMPLYRRYADTAGFPDVSHALEQLGVHIANGKVELRNDAELAGIRTSMTKMDPQTARWRQRLAVN